MRGDGVWVYDASGRRDLDAYDNVAHVGHAHPRVVDAIHAEARLLNTNTRFTAPPSTNMVWDGETPFNEIFLDPKPQ